MHSSWHEISSVSIRINFSAAVLFTTIISSPIKLSEEEADLVITDNATNLTIEFTTPGPQLSETPIDEYTKKVTVSSKIHYTNIITYTNLPTEAEPSQIHIYWFNVTENCTTDNQTNTTNCRNRGN